MPSALVAIDARVPGLVAPATFLRCRLGQTGAFAYYDIANVGCCGAVDIITGAIPNKKLGKNQPEM
jgi:hypothetical protein